MRSTLAASAGDAWKIFLKASTSSGDTTAVRLGDLGGQRNDADGEGNVLFRFAAVPLQPEHVSQVAQQAAAGVADSAREIGNLLPDGHDAASPVPFCRTPETIASRPYAR